MQKEVTLTNNELPQLRQMVLENTRRINNNEQMIKEMRKRETEEEWERRERDEFWESVNRDHALARQEHDRDMRELRQMFKESDKRMEESRIEFKKELEESRRKHEQDMRELKQTLKETDEQIKEAAKEVKQLSIQFNGETGHIVEGLVSSSAEKLFQKFGLDLHNSGKNLRRHLKSEKTKMEVDVLLNNDEVVVPIEVKTKFTEENLNRFLHQMGLFRKLFPEHADKKVIAAIAAIDYDKNMDTLARDMGLLVIRVNSDDVFSIDPFDMEKLKKF